MIETELVAEHTIARLPRVLDAVLDVGCRRFDFSKIMLDRGYKVVGIEADDEVVPIKHENFYFGNYALVPESQNGVMQTLIKFGNGTANHLSNVKGSIPRNRTVNQVIGLSVTEIGQLFEVKRWNVIKLDCEGAEYEVLLEWPGPVADQITVEFHEHTGANTRDKSVYGDIMSHLSQWYEVVQHESSVRYCLSTPNYWDSLFVLKGLFS